MIDLPASMAGDNFAGIDIGGIREKVEDMRPLLTIIKDTWTHETLKDIAAGKVFVSDKVIEDAVKKHLAAGDKALLKNVSLSIAEDRLNIACQLMGGNKLELSGKIKEFVHNKDASFITFSLDKHKMPGHGIYSWLFANLSLSMVQNIMGDIPLGNDNLPVSLKGSDLRVDLTRMVADSAFGRAKFSGYSLREAVVIESAKLRSGGLELNTKLNMPEDYKKALLDITERAQAKSAGVLDRVLPWRGGRDN